MPHYGLKLSGNKSYKAMHPSLKSLVQIIIGVCTGGQHIGGFV